MKINFPIINLTNIGYQPYKRQNYLKPLGFDTFERTSFTGSSEVGTSTHSFEIKNIKNLRCPVCGLIMLTDSQINEFVNDIKEKRGYELVDALEKYEDDSYFTGIEEDVPRSIFRPQKQEIVDIIKDLALQFPKKSLSELIDYEAQRRIDILIKDQMKVVDELETYIKRCSATRPKKELARNLLEEHKKLIRGEGEQRFSRKRFIYDFSDIAYDPTTQKKITEIAEKLPTSEQDVNSWFVKYSKSLKSADIARKLVQQSIPTAEHLVPKSKDGANSAKNYICDCSDCNSRRSDMEFDKWMLTIPNFKENLQQYLQDVQDAIDSGKLSRKSNSYIENIIETIKKLSNEQILLDMPNSTDDGKRERMLQAREAKMDKIAKYIKERGKIKKEKQKEIEVLESHPYYQNLYMLEMLERSIEHTKDEIKTCEDKDRMAQLKSEINDIQEKIDKCRDYIANADNIDDEINHLKTTISSMQRTQAQLSKIKEQIDKEGDLRYRQSKLIAENIDLSVQNSKIIQSQGFDDKDNSEYERYQHLNELILTSNSMLRTLNSKSNREKEKEIIWIALNTISENIEQCLEKDSVKYFMNEAKMKENKAQIEILDEQLQEIENKKSFAEVYERDLRIAGSGKSIEQLQDRLKELIGTREIIVEIHKLPEYRIELENISAMISFDKSILHKLKKRYETMTNEEFTQQTNLIY